MAKKKITRKKVNKGFDYDICIIGGLGHVGLPLGVAFADKGQRVCLLDLDEEKAKMVNKGIMPFIEYGAEALLKKALKKKLLSISTDQECIARSKFVICAVGTPVDEYLNPKVREFLELFKGIGKYITKNQIVIVRSTVYPRTCEQVNQLFKNEGKVLNLAYCPERIAQGYSIEELMELPQIVAGLTKKAIKEASELFSLLSPKIIPTSIPEAELVKLYLNAWRYIQFAVTNQFYMMATNFGVDYTRVRNAMVEEYGRAASLPSAGFAAGPCLLKDTMQLSAFNSNNFLLGHAAMMVNEGLPNYLIEILRNKYDLNKMKVGILGMAFKANIDDVRDSLSFKLGKILRFHGADVYYSDEFVKDDPTMVSKETIIKNCKIIIIGVPHSAYKKIKFPRKAEVIDLWEIINPDKK